MGIKNLNQFLKKYKVQETLHISTLQYKKIAIDTPMFLFKFKGVTEPSTNNWLGCFITFISFLRKWDIHPIFVFEGKAPPEKALAQEERRSSRQKMVDKTEAIENDLKAYIGTGTISPLLLQTWEKLKFKNNKNLLLKRTLTNSFINTELIKEELERRKRYDINITSKDILNLKNLLTLMGISWVQSDHEAETDCISMFYDNLVEYIVSEDTDVMAYFHHNNEKELKVITSFNTTNLTFTQLSKVNVLSTLKLSSESFRDFCIMCGTDYNKNIPRIGTETSYKLISKWQTIESVPLDTTSLNHKRIRDLFKVKSNLKLQNKTKWCRLPHIDKLIVFMDTYNLNNINIDNTIKALSEPNFILEIDLI